MTRENDGLNDGEEKAMGMEETALVEWRTERMEVDGNKNKGHLS